MNVSKDALWKSIIESLIDDFLRYFFPDYVDQIDFDHGFEFLDTELQKLIPDNPGKKRHADKLIKVWLLSGAEVWFLIHVEVQGYQDALFAQRMFECIYRIRDKFQRPVTGLAIYTDWDRTYHLQEYKDVFLGSEVTYKFNTYVLRDHSPNELANDPNPFAAVMEAAWQHLDKPKDDQTLRALKLDLIQRLKARKISKKKISLIIDFIKYFAAFTNSEINANFEQDLIDLSKTGIPMGLREAILDDVKKQGIEIGEAKRDEELLNNAVPELMQEGFSAERIAAILNLPLESVQTAIDEFLNREIPNQAKDQHKNVE
jgi:predicted transposase/invertase (TIGR01784 family)